MFPYAKPKLKVTTLYALEHTYTHIFISLSHSVWSKQPGLAVSSPHHTWHTHTHSPPPSLRCACFCHSWPEQSLESLLDQLLGEKTKCKMDSGQREWQPRDKQVNKWQMSFTNDRNLPRQWLWDGNDFLSLKFAGKTLRISNAKKR